MVSTRRALGHSEQRGTGGCKFPVTGSLPVRNKVKLRKHVIDRGKYDSAEFIAAQFADPFVCFASPAGPE